MLFNLRNLAILSLATSATALPTDTDTPKNGDETPIFSESSMSPSHTDLASNETFLSPRDVANAPGQAFELNYCDQKYNAKHGYCLGTCNIAKGSAETEVNIWTSRTKCVWQECSEGVEPFFIMCPDWKAKGCSRSDQVKKEEFKVMRKGKEKKWCFYDVNKFDMIIVPPRKY